MKYRALWVEDQALLDLEDLSAPVIMSGNYELDVAESTTQGVASRHTGNKSNSSTRSFHQGERERSLWRNHPGCDLPANSKVSTGTVILRPFHSRDRLGSDLRATGPRISGSQELKLH